MALHHWASTAYQDVGNVFDGEDMEKEIEAAAIAYDKSDKSEKTLTELATKAYDDADAYKDDGEFKESWKEQNVKDDGSVDDPDLEGTSWEEVWAVYSGAYRAAAIPQVKKFILERHAQLEEDGEFEEEIDDRSDLLDLLEAKFPDDDLHELCLDMLEEARGKGDGDRDVRVALRVVAKHAPELAGRGKRNLIELCKDLVELAEERAEEEGDDDDEEAEEDAEEDVEETEEGEDDLDEEDDDAEEDEDDEDE